MLPAGIGLSDSGVEGMFTWTDGTPVDFLAWGPGASTALCAPSLHRLISWLAGEPNNFELSTRTTYMDQGQGEDAVGISFNNNNGVGGWNDEHPYGTAGTGVYGYFVRHSDLFPELRKAQP